MVGRSNGGVQIVRSPAPRRRDDLVDGTCVASRCWTERSGATRARGPGHARSVAGVV